MKIHGAMKKILVVEDNELNLEMLQRRLTRRGFAVTTAQDGQEAIEKTFAENPDLILMDMNLPVLDGWEATRQIKRDEKLKNIPVIALTAHAMSDDEDKALNAGCDDFATKPVDFGRLLEKIEKHLKTGGDRG